MGKLFQSSKKLFLFSGIILVALCCLAFINKPFSSHSNYEVSETVEEGILWMSWEEAVEASKKEKKKIFIDMYTNWCGWCKKMDATTFKNSEIVEILNKDFYPVKFNAEQKESITWRETTFKFVNAGRRGVHELAYSLLDGRLGYPSYVYLDEDFNRITISPGYKQVDGLKEELTFVTDEHYKTKTFSEYKNKK